MKKTKKQNLQIWTISKKKKKKKVLQYIYKKKPLANWDYKRKKKPKLAKTVGNATREERKGEVSDSHIQQHAKKQRISNLQREEYIHTHISLSLNIYVLVTQIQIQFLLPQFFLLGNPIENPLRGLFNFASNWSTPYRLGLELW